MNRKLSLLDSFFSHLDLARKTLLVQPKAHQRDYPSKESQDTFSLLPQEKKHAAGLMRVNHTGEVCAQALYQGQAITARSNDVREKMRQAAEEEFDHLAWCNRRLAELQSHASYLNVVWYVGALGIGIAAGCLGDKWSLSFLAETEAQVVWHLDSHLGELPENDTVSRLIVTQMREDEARHRNMAHTAGAVNLPQIIKGMMRVSSQVMTKLAYYL